MRTVTKADLAKKFSEKIGIEVKEAKQFIELFLDTVLKSLEEGMPVKIAGLGNFRLRRKAGRPGLNPRTGERVLVKPRRVVTFTAGEKLKEQVRGNLDSDLGDI